MIDALLVPVIVAAWAGAVLAVVFVTTSIWSAIAATARLVQAERRRDSWDLSARDLTKGSRPYPACPQYPPPADPRRREPQIDRN